MKIHDFWEEEGKRKSGRIRKHTGFPRFCVDSFVFLWAPSQSSVRSGCAGRSGELPLREDQRAGVASGAVQAQADARPSGAERDSKLRSGSAKRALAEGAKAGSLHW